VRSPLEERKNPRPCWRKRIHSVTHQGVRMKKAHRPMTTSVSREQLDQERDGRAASEHGRLRRGEARSQLTANCPPRSWFYAAGGWRAASGGSLLATRVLCTHVIALTAPCAAGSPDHRCLAVISFVIALGGSRPSRRSRNSGLGFFVSRTWVGQKPVRCADADLRHVVTSAIRLADRIALSDRAGPQRSSSPKTPASPCCAARSRS